MVSILIDANLDGHGNLLDMRLRTDTWRELRDHLDLHFLHLDNVGLDRAANDDIVWRHCQQRGYFLLTANRNRRGDDSLEVTIRREGTAQSLPVFTFADADRIFQSVTYLDQVVVSLLEYLQDEANCRGAGRLFLP